MLARVYEETFTIAAQYYRIQKVWRVGVEFPIYRLYMNNSPDTFESPDINECRIYAHADALKHFQKYMEAHEIAVETYKDILRDLGDNPENMEKFKTPCTFQLK